MKKRNGTQVCVIISNNQLIEMDNMIEQDLYSSRSSILRRALKEFMEKKQVYS